MNDAQLAAAVESNYSKSFALLTRACGGEVLETDGILAAASGIPVAMLNHGFIKRRPADPERSLREVVEFFDAAGLPFVIRIREGLAPRFEEVATATGIPYSDTVPGMALHPIPPVPAPPSGFKIEPVRSPALGTYREVVAEGFGMPLALAEQLLTPAMLEIPGMVSYLGTLEGKAVATSACYSSDGTVGVYNVAVVPSLRRRGLGEAMTWRAIAEGVERGCSIATLQASVMGEPVYTRMGFRNVAPHKSFTRSQEEAT
jgi:ribosomal protein S18 acetylase RimI-like enzyme